MKKQILLFIAITALGAAHAQTTIPNGGFENWTNVGQLTEQPTNWNSNRTGGGFASSGPETCFRDTSTLGGGSYCTMIMTGTIVGTVVNGSCTTGEVEAPSFTKTEGYIQTVAGDASHSAPFTGRPDSLVFWYRFSPRGTDSPTVQARVHVGNAYAPETPVNSNHPDSTVNIIGRAIWTGTNTAQATWQRVSVPFVYVDNRTPQYILITMTGSADAAAGTDSTTLWVDEIQAIYNPNGISEVKQPTVKTYWHGTTMIADLTGQGLTDVSLQIISMTGTVMADQPLNGNAINAVATDVAPGVYIYRIVSAQATMTGKTIKQ